MPAEKLKLHGFNNLTKTLSFNLYDICYTCDAAQRQRYIEYIEEQYNALRLTRILHDVASIIDATVLNVARQDYEPEGASVTMLIAEGPMHPGPTHSEPLGRSKAPGALPESLVGHLDKSHLTVHTYPDHHPDHGVVTLRVDIDVSTCGHISPLRALDYLIHSFASDVVVLDYRVRGFTRDVTGRKHFIDHPMHSIQTFISGDTRRRYRAQDVNVEQENLFHTKMVVREFNLDHYLFEAPMGALEAAERERISERLEQEIMEIYQGRNRTLGCE